MPGRTASAKPDSRSPSASRFGEPTRSSACSRSAPSEPAFDIAEWGFALGAEHWGSGVFTDGAELVLDFVFDVIGVHRLEARAALKNGRGNGALQKLGATQEGILHRSFLRKGMLFATR